MDFGGADRRLLRGLLSTGSADILRRDIANDPSLLGKTVDYEIAGDAVRATFASTIFGPAVSRPPPSILAMSTPI